MIFETYKILSNVRGVKNLSFIARLDIWKNDFISVRYTRRLYKRNIYRWKARLSRSVKKYG